MLRLPKINETFNLDIFSKSFIQNSIPGTPKFACNITWYVHTGWNKNNIAVTKNWEWIFSTSSGPSCSITLTLPWDEAPPRKGPPGGQKPRKLKWASDQPFYVFLPHVFFTKYTNTLLISNAKLMKWVVEWLWYTNSKWSYDLMIFKIPLASLSSWK